MVALTVSASAASRGDRNPGSYRDWNDVDEVTIVHSFELAHYRQIIVAPLDTHGVWLPPKEENTYPLAREVLSTSSSLFFQGLNEKISGTNLQVTQSSTGHVGLLVRARLEKLDPGSKAARMWVPGAGTAQTTISGEILDAATNQVLVRFRQERRAAVKTIFQRESVLLSRTLKQIGWDIAALLKAF